MANLYIAYTRVSTKMQGTSGLGLEAQKDMIDKFISSNSDNILLNTYTEVESGKRDDRKELAKALHECKQKGATLLIAKLDRLSRKTSFILKLMDSGCQFKALDLPEFNFLTATIFSAIAEHELRLISQRTKAALQAKKAQGFKLGAPNPHLKKEWREIGYEVIRNKANTNENNLKAKVAIEGMLRTTSNKSEIARQLNANGFKTSKGGEFSVIQVLRIMRRYGLSESV
ncbi:MAG: recombinase family protein [Bacteroides sp.]|nr:recombinase family protein [Bacteroides sp.]